MQILVMYTWTRYYPIPLMIRLSPCYGFQYVRFGVNPYGLQPLSC
jgi:hypothetical protein